MAKRLGILGQMMWGQWADRDAINRNADTLESVEATVSHLQATVAQQAHEILRLRATSVSSRSSRRRCRSTTPSSSAR